MLQFRFRSNLKSRGWALTHTKLGLPLTSAFRNPKAIEFWSTLCDEEMEIMEELENDPLRCDLASFLRCPLRLDDGSIILE